MQLQVSQKSPLQLPTLIKLNKNKVEQWKHFAGIIFIKLLKKNTFYWQVRFLPVGRNSQLTGNTHKRKWRLNKTSFSFFFFSVAKGIVLSRSFTAVSSCKNKTFWNNLHIKNPKCVSSIFDDFNIFRLKWLGTFLPYSHRKRFVIQKTSYFSLAKWKSTIYNA